jgi:hypothetical protein
MINRRVATAPVDSPPRVRRYGERRQTAAESEEGASMRYMLLIYGDEKQWANQSPEEQRTEFEAYDSFGKWLAEKGWIQGGEALQPTAAATSVKLRDGKLLTTDGPFAETKEQLGGFYQIQCENLDQAIEAASKIPAARSGTIEVRPIAEFPSE